MEPLLPNAAGSETNANPRSGRRFFGVVLALVSAMSLTNLALKRPNGIDATSTIETTSREDNDNEALSVKLERRIAKKKRRNKRHQMPGRVGVDITDGNRDPYGNIRMEDGTSDVTVVPRRAPRALAIDASYSLLTVALPVVADFEKNSMPDFGIKTRIKPHWYDLSPEVSKDVGEECGPMYDWQFQSFPNCNSFHELDLSQMRPIGKGAARMAFEMRQILDGKEQKFVYKTSMFQKNLYVSTWERQRRDALVMERTTTSKFIPDIHGYCGLAVTMDYMPEGDFFEYIIGARRAGGSELRAVDKLRIAIHIATGVADLHTIDGTPIPSYFHNDIHPMQYIFQNGLFKLTDFHMARPIYINKQTKEECPREELGMDIHKHRSLEEHQHELGRVERLAVNADKVDVWMLGNILYYTLTDLYLFEKPFLNCTEAGREMVEGRRSPYPKEIAKTKDPSLNAMKKAIAMCWTHGWRERPSARSVADYLMEQLRGITGEEDPDLRVTLPARDPHQKPTSDDWHYFNQ